MRKRPTQATVSPRDSAAFHPRNRHQGEYDFAALIACSPPMRTFVRPNAHGNLSIDFADSRAVRALNAALLHSQYGIAHWQLPAGYLCPPIPGRADYVHGLADLLAQDHNQIPIGPSIRALDIGTGASCIYPLIGVREYGWCFVGSDIDANALASARAIVEQNPGLAERIELRPQSTRAHIFNGIVAGDERFELTLCNPPFHASAAEAAQGSERKWRKLGEHAAAAAPRLNFGGQRDELWCRGGELAMVSQMIDESALIGSQVLWFTSLISRSAHLPALSQRLQSLGASAVRTVPMAQGQKQSRFLAWSFLDARARSERLRSGA